jgi:hypothetical protein
MNPAQVSSIDPAALEAQLPLVRQPRPLERQRDAAVRLSIEEGPQGYVYKFFDASTGQLLKQYPHAELVRFAQSPGYEPGAIFNLTL